MTTKTLQEKKNMQSLTNVGVLYKTTNKKYIYVYSYPKYINNPEDKNLKRIICKVGQTIGSVWYRVESQMTTSTPEGAVILRVYEIEKCYSDYDVHNIIKNNGAICKRDEVKNTVLENQISNCGAEWFETSLADIDNAVMQLSGTIIYKQDKCVKKSIINNENVKSNIKKSIYELEFERIYKYIVDKTVQNEITLFYINFVDIIKKYPGFLKNWNYFYVEDDVPMLYTDNKFREKFNSSNIGSKEFNFIDYVTVIDLKYVFNKIFIKIKEDYINKELNFLNVYKGLKLDDDFNSEFTSFNTNLYSFKIFNKIYYKLTNLTSDSKILLYRMNFDVFDKLCKETNANYSNVTIIVNSDMMKNIWISYLVSKYNVSNDYIINNIKVIPNKDFLKYNFDDMKFDVCLTNPPYSSSTGNKIDAEIVKKCKDISKTCIAIIPAKIQKESYLFDNNVSDIIFVNPNIFGISPKGAYDYLGIFTIDTDVHNEINITTTDNNNHIVKSDIVSTDKFLRSLKFDKEYIQIINRKSSLRDELFSLFGRMVNDSDDYIYEDGKMVGKTRYNITKDDDKGAKRRNSYLKDGIYKYCLYKGSYQNDYDEVQEGDVKTVFKGQICWFTNKLNVKNNIKYWLECPLMDMWRRYYLCFVTGNACCTYGELPALNFDMDENDFRDYVDSLNDFSEDEIITLKKYNVHNA